MAQEPINASVAYFDPSQSDPFIIQPAVNGAALDVDTLKQDILSSLHVAMPGIVESYDSSAHTATVQPALRRRTRSGTVLTAPLLRQVPVFVPSPDFTVSPGAHCLLIFADFCIDGWAESGQPVLPPSPRRHDLSDAFALVGFYPPGRG